MKGFLKKNFIYVLAALGLHACLQLSLAVMSGGYSCCGAQILEHRLNSYVTWAELLRGRWDLPRPGIEPSFLN